MVFIGIAVLIDGVAPHLIHFSWLPIVAATVFSVFGQVLGLSQQTIELSPFSQTDLSILLAFAGFGVIAVGGGLWGSSLREISK